MKIAVAGAGSVGGLVAWFLARAGLAPTIVARGPAAAAIARDGLTVTGPRESATVAVAATSDPGSLGPQDLVFAGYKAHDWPAGLAQVRPLLGPGTVLVPMLNGVPWWFFQGWGGALAGRTLEAVDRGGALAAAIPPGAIVGCVVYVGAARETPSRIAWNDRRRFVIGEPAAAGSERLARLAALLRGAGLEIEEAADIRRALWMKLLGNATYNTLSVVTGATIGAMAADPEQRALLRAMLVEVAEIGRALGVCGEVDIEQRLTPIPELRDFRTSTLQDFDAGRPLELGALVDAVVELGLLVGRPAPTLERIGAAAEARWRARHGAPAQTGTG